MAVTWKKIAYYDTLLTVEEQEIVGRLTGGNVDGITIGIADNNMVQVDGTTNSPVNGDYAKWTASGVEGKAAAEVKTDLSLNLVENTAHSTDAHTMTIDGRDVSVDGTALDTAVSKLAGIEAGADKTDATNVDAAGAVMESDTDYLDKTHLSQDFGATGGRLYNLIPSPLAGEILRIANCGGCAFYGVIDDNAGAHGGQGLDATHVPYDGDTYEDMFNGLEAYDGSAKWGQIIVHNTTRSNSRKIVSADRTNNVITTTSSTDDWADNDVITCESQTNEGSGTFVFADVDISAKVGTGVAAIVLQSAMTNNTAGDNSNNALFYHPLETYDAGKRVYHSCALANEKDTASFILPVISQKVTFCAWQSGTNDNYIVMTVTSTVEYADT